MNKNPFIRLAFFFLSLLGNIAVVSADLPSKDDPIRIGFVGSLSSFAQNYGTAVLDGARLAVSELERDGIKIDLRVEDDQSITKNAVTGYIKLATIDHVRAVVGGSWWANAFVKRAERDGVILLSCETLYNDDVVLGKSYFIMNGDLRNWVRVYSPVVEKTGWKRAAIIRYVSGFGATLAREVETLFSSSGRQFAGAIEYSDIDIADAANIVLKLKKLQVDVVYIDAQPGGLATLLKKMSEAGMTNMNIMTHSIAEDVKRDGLLDLSGFKNLYFTKRVTFDDDFAKKFQEKYGKAPSLNSDLGYYSVYLFVEALKSPDPIARIKRGLTIKGRLFTFDDHNVYAGVPQEVYKIEGANVTRWSD